jgi:hypothetical protein
MNSNRKKTIPFQFVLDELDSLRPRTNPMFGCFGVYVGEKIVMALRSRDTNTSDNGIWVSTKAVHHESLRKTFPSMRSIAVLGNGETNWQIIPEEADDFEEAAFKLCELIAKGDERIGNIPKPKKKK